MEDSKRVQKLSSGKWGVLKTDGKGYMRVNFSTKSEAKSFLSKWTANQQKLMARLGKSSKK
jgi:hypothetical protein